MPVGECLHWACPYAQMDGQVKNIMPQQPQPIGWAVEA